MKYLQTSPFRLQFKSLPSWERGLKSYMETTGKYWKWSLPSWERGLKYFTSSLKKHCCYVAPLVGAWIEIPKSKSDSMKSSVAPLVGAWIEMRYQHNIILPVPSLPSWERGLKFICFCNYNIVPLSLPSWERGLKSRYNLFLSFGSPVAPLVGAWIEIT